MFISILSFHNNLYSNTSLESIDDFGVASLVYHRFEKINNTNIKINDFKEHIKIIEQGNIKFINPKDFENELINNKLRGKSSALLTMAFSHFMKMPGQSQKKKYLLFYL